MTQYQTVTPIHTARSGEYFLQPVERYMYTDNVTGSTVFNITKLPPRRRLDNMADRAFVKMTIRYKRNTALTALNVCSRSWQTGDLTERVPDYWLNVLDMSTESAHKFDLEVSLFFAKQNNLQLRNGCLKKDFISILIDPRISCNLPGDSRYLDELTIKKRFLSSIFYVGVATQNKPYFHLMDSLQIYQHRIHETNRHRRKHQRILDIWRSSYGVVCLNVFPNISPNEAQTRKTAITEVLGLDSGSCELHGPPKAWSSVTRQLWGGTLLQTAMQCYLEEGEILVFPTAGKFE